MAVMATVAKAYDLDYAWRAVGEGYRGPNLIRFGDFVFEVKSATPWRPVSFSAHIPVNRCKAGSRTTGPSRHGRGAQSTGRPPVTATRAPET